MNNLNLKGSILALALFASGIASADSNFGIGVKAGTLGLGLEGRWQALPLVDLRVGANSYEYTDNGDQAGINYDGTLTLETFYLTGNFHFPASPFRVTAGAFSNGNEILMVSGDNGSFNIGGIDYPADAVGTLTSDTTFEAIVITIDTGIYF